MSAYTNKTNSRHMRRGPGFRAAVITSVLAAAALVLLLPQPAYAAAPWDIKGAVEEAIKGWLLDGACGFFNMYNGLVSAIGDNGILTAPFSSLLGESVYSITVTVHQTAVVPLAESILALFMLVQLIKISQRMDATATLPAIKDIVFLAVTYVLLHWFIIHSLDIVQAIYQMVVDNIMPVVGSVGKEGAFLGESISTENFDLSKVTFGGCFTTLIVAILCAFTGIVAYVVAFVVAYARAWQIYVMAAFSSIPMALLGFDETRQMGVGFLKNFAAAALAGAIMLFLLVAFPHILASLTSQMGSDNILALAAGEVAIDALQGVLMWLGCSFLLVFGLIKSGAWAKEILGS